MKVVIPSLIFENSNKLEQLKLTLVTIHSYYYHNSKGDNLPIVVLTNNDFIRKTIEKYANNTKQPISVDLKPLDDIVYESLVYDFFHNKNEGKTIQHNENVNCLYFYSYLNYDDAIILDNDMLFTSEVKFKELCKDETTYVDFSNYNRSREKEWDIQYFNKDDVKDNFSTHGGCLYIPKNNVTRSIVKELIEGEYDYRIEMNGHPYYLTEEYFRVVLSLKGLLKSVKKGINIYGRYEYSKPLLIHLENKPYKVIINKSKEVVIKSPKPITEYNSKSIDQVLITKHMLITYLTWYKHLAFCNEVLDRYFIDINHVNSNFFVKILEAIR